MANGGLTSEEKQWLNDLAGFQPNMYDINPEKLTGQWIYGLYCGGGSGSQKEFVSIPVAGYDKFAFYNNNNAQNFKISFYNASGEKVTDDLTLNIGANAWSDYQDIPEGTVLIYSTSVWYTENVLFGSYSLLTKDSPYNPDNQTP